MRGLLSVLGVSVLLVISGCGGTPKAQVPVDSALRPWQAPEPAEAAPAADPPATPAAPTE